MKAFLQATATGLFLLFTIPLLEGTSIGITSTSDVLVMIYKKCIAEGRRRTCPMFGELQKVMAADANIRDLVHAEIVREDDLVKSLTPKLLQAYKKKPTGCIALFVREEIQKCQENQGQNSGKIGDHSCTKVPVWAFFEYLRRNPEDEEYFNLQARRSCFAQLFQENLRRALPGMFK